MLRKKKGPIWRRTSPDISGSISEVASELVQEIKRAPLYSEMTLRILNGSKSFTYSAQVSKGKVLEISEKHRLCEFDSNRRGIRGYNPPMGCSECAYDAFDKCVSVKTLMDLKTYMIQYNGFVTIKSTLFDKAEKQKAADEEFVQGEMRKRRLVY